MTSEREMDELAVHLDEVRPIFDEFCAQFGFSYVPRQAIGRYPRIRIARLGTIRLWLDLWMELDEHGRRFEKFRRDLPYELAAGAHVDEEDGSQHGVRYQKAFACFNAKPFDQVALVLREELEKGLHVIEKWDVDYLKQHGKKVRLGGG